MTTIASEENYSDWLADVKKQAGEYYEYYSEWYSFRAAYDERMKPSEAIADCKEWLES